MFSEPWIKLAAKFGLWAVLAIFLVYRLDRSFSTTLDATRADVASTKAMLETHVGVMSTTTAALQQLVNLQLQQCVNGADDYVKRDRCFQAQWQTPTREGR